MQIKYDIQRNDMKIEYEFDSENEIVKASIGEVSDVFDFSTFPEGAILDDVISPLNDIFGTSLIKSAERKNGELYIILKNTYSRNANQEELFPDWKVI